MLKLRPMAGVVRSVRDYSVHKTALNSFNQNHADYDKLRLSFLPEIVDPFLKYLGLVNTDKKVLELGAGTGKFTKNLTENGISENLIVVEPSEGMLKSFSQNFPLVEALVGSSYDLPLEDNSVDAIVASQAFHWFSDEKSLKELSRVLKPEGRMGFIWNADAPSVSQKLLQPFPQLKIIFKDVPQDVETRLTEEADSLPISSDKAYRIYEEFANEHPWSVVTTNFVYELDTKVPQYRHGKWKQLLASNDFFTPIEKEIFLFYNALAPKHSIFGTWATRSYITALSNEERSKLEEKFNHILDNSITDSDIIVKDGSVFLNKPVATHAVIVQNKK